MKEKILTIMFSLFCLTAIGQNNQNSTLLGDANGDGKVDVADIVEIVNFINDISSENFNFTNADFNKDEKVNNLDIQDIKNIILSKDSEYQLFAIKEDNLDGWNEGIYCMTNSNQDFYIVSYTDVTEDGESYISFCMNSADNFEYDKSVVFTYTEEGELKSIMTAGFLFMAYQYSDIFLFVVYDDNGENVGTFVVPAETVSLNTGSLTRGHASHFYNSKGKISIPKMKEFWGKINGYVEGVSDFSIFLWNFDQGNYDEILLDYIVDKFVGLAKLSWKAKLIAIEGLKWLMEHAYNQAISALLGDAHIEITSIKRINESIIKVDATINNISTIPKTRFTYYRSYDEVITEEVPNEVFWGIAESKSGKPGLYLNTNCTGTLPISADKVSFSFNISRELGETLYFRPFLAPNQELQPPLFTFIRYGERKEFIDIDVTLLNFKQICSYKENGKNKVRVSFDGEIPGICQDLSGWGFEVKTKSGTFAQLLYAQENTEIYPPLQKSFVCDISLDEKDIIDNGEDLIAEIIIKPFFTLRNSNILLNYLDDLKYTVTVVQPAIKIETGEATAIKTTTAKLNGSVENYDKEDENIKFAFLYSKSEDIQNSSDGRTVEASCDDNGNLTADISDLTDYTTYYYAAAYKDGDADYVLGEVKSFKTKPSVTTIENPEVTVVSAKLQGTCSKGIYNAYISVKKDGETEYTQYFICPDENGNICLTIDGLELETKYYYYTFIQADDQTYKGTEYSFTTKLLCPDNHHPHLINLGLPSGTKWACCNEGANKPEQYGGYYAWGETREKDWYSWKTYSHAHVVDKEVLDEYYAVDYSDDGLYYQTNDIGNNIASTQYDSARTNWGEAWRLPTFDECQALVNLSSVWITFNGVDGRIFIGANGNGIFLPAAGGRYNNVLGSEGWGYYQSGTLKNDVSPWPPAEYIISFCNDLIHMSYWAVYNGKTVRPVQN